MPDDLESAIARVVEASRGVRPGPADSARMGASLETMRTTLARVAATSLFDTEPVHLAATLEALADDGSPR